MGLQDRFSSRAFELSIIWLESGGIIRQPHRDDQITANGRDIFLICQFSNFALKIWSYIDEPRGVKVILDPFLQEIC